MRERITQLDELGSLDAEKGSRAWAIAVRNKLNSVLQQAEFSSKAAKGYFVALKETAGWRQLFDEKACGFMSFEQFCCYRKPFGLGYDINHIEHIIREREEREAKDILNTAGDLAKQKVGVEGGKPGPGRGNKTAADSSRFVCGTTHSPYLAARIKRDHPDIAERIQAGEFRSIHAAAIAAGIAKPTITIRPTVEGFTKAIKKRLTPEQIKELVQNLSGA